MAVFFTGSQIERRWKIAAVAAVLFGGAWVFPFPMTFIAPKMDGVRPYYVSYLLLLIVAVRTLWLTWAVESKSNHGIAIAHA